MVAKKIKIAFGSDHVGLELKPTIMEYVKSLAMKFMILGLRVMRELIILFTGKRLVKPWLAETMIWEL